MHVPPRRLPVEKTVFLREFWAAFRRLEDAADEMIGKAAYFRFLTLLGAPLKPWLALQSPLAHGAVHRSWRACPYLSSCFAQQRCMMALSEAWSHTRRSLRMHRPADVPGGARGRDHPGGRPGRAPGRDQRRARALGGRHHAPGDHPCPGRMQGWVQIPW